jgi:hypothetical protein
MRWKSTDQKDNDGDGSRESTHMNTRYFELALTQGLGGF